MVAGEYLRYPSDDQTDAEADGDGEEQTECVVDSVDVAEDPYRQAKNGQDRECRRDVGAPIECRGQLVAGGTYEERADDRGEHADGGNRQREHDRLCLEVTTNEHDRRKGNRSNQRTDVGLEEIRTHTGDVTDVVPNIVGDHGRVTGIVLRDARLYLSDQVRTDIGSLGVDPSADAGE